MMQHNSKNTNRFIPSNDNFLSVPNSARSNQSTEKTKKEEGKFKAYFYFKSKLKLLKK